MVFITMEDFYEKANLCYRITRQEEIEYAKKMNDGDMAAREKIIQGYMPMVAGHIKHMSPNIQNLGLVLYCVRALERAVDSFDFLQNSETFSHRLSWWLRQAVIDYQTRS